MNKLTLLACLCLTASLPVSAQTNEAEPTLTGRAAAERVIGNTLVIVFKDIPWSKGLDPVDMETAGYFSPDGRFAARVTINDVEMEKEKQEGRWSIDDQGHLCAAEKDKPIRKMDCLGLIVTGDAIKSVPEKELSGAIVTLIEGNPHGL